MEGIRAEGSNLSTKAQSIRCHDQHRLQKSMLWNRKMEKIIILCFSILKKKLNKYTYTCDSICSPFDAMQQLNQGILHLEHSTRKSWVSQSPPVRSLLPPLIPHFSGWYSWWCWRRGSYPAPTAWSEPLCGSQKKKKFAMIQCCLGVNLWAP